jgi:catechol 2,3-dioxygenase-like lactoylglutathione lyase family enzyme
MTYKIEVLILPVSDVDRALAFYSEKAGFTLDVDYRPSDDFRVVQLTPPGSACSIQIGVGLTDVAPGSIGGIHTVVEDLRAARDELLERGVEVGEIRHKSPRGAWRGGWEQGSIPTGPTTRPSPTSPIPTATDGCCRNAASATSPGAPRPASPRAPRRWWRHIAWRPSAVTVSTVASGCSSPEAIERMARATPAGSSGTGKRRFM